MDVPRPTSYRTIAPLLSLNMTAMACMHILQPPRPMRGGPVLHDWRARPIRERFFRMHWTGHNSSAVATALVDAVAQAQATRAGPPPKTALQPAFIMPKPLFGALSAPRVAVPALAATDAVYMFEQRDKGQAEKLKALAPIPLPMILNTLSVPWARDTAPCPSVRSVVPRTRPRLPPGIGESGRTFAGDPPPHSAWGGPLIIRRIF